MEIFQLVLLFEVFAVAGGLALGGASMDAIEFVWCASDAPPPPNLAFALPGHHY